MTTANTENEDLQGLLTPTKKKEDTRPKGPVQHQSLPVDSSGGSWSSAPVQPEPLNGNVDTLPKGPVQHQTEPLDGSGGAGDDEPQPDGPVQHQKTEPKPPARR